mgnify:CR=1 FL=1
MDQEIRYRKIVVLNEKGVVLVVVLLLAAILVVLGTTAVMMSTTDMKISANYKTGNQAFFAAEAGIEEARARLRTNAANPITDSHPTNIGWLAFIGSEVKAQGKGYSSGNALHVLVASLQNVLDYTVRIEHANDGANVLYWNGTTRNTATGTNIYKVTSTGTTAGANKTIVAEIHRPLPIEVPAALYVEAATTIQGTSTYVNGNDSCGGANKPGIVTTLATTTVTENGNPTITGSPDRIVSNPGGNLDVQAMIDNLKSDADYSYGLPGTSVAGATHTGMTWGTPTPGATQQDPSTCSEHNIVYYNTSNGTNPTDIKLSGGSQGCGILLIDGDFEASGDFFWHGIVMVSGSVRITGGGNKNITGGIVAGGSADADLVGGNVHVVYCSTAVNSQTQSAELKNLTWKEEM